MTDSLLNEDLRMAFLRSVVQDLNSADVLVAETREWIRSTGIRGSRPSPLLERAGSANDRRVLLERASRQKLYKHFAATEDVASVIAPRVFVCRTRVDHDVFSLLHVQQRVVSAPRVGRRLRFLVIDEGQHQPVVIGATEIASPIYEMAARDRHLHWQGQSARTTREAGLRRLMDMSSCTAAPGFRELRVGKLLAALACGSTVADAFAERYGERLLGITTTCATGLHYPQVRGITFGGPERYRRIGATAGYTTAWFSPETLSLARVIARGDSRASDFSKALPVLRAALDALALPSDVILRSAAPKGVYLAEAVDGATALLRDGRSAYRPAPRDAEIVAWWMDNVLRRSSRCREPAARVTSAGSPATIAA